MQITIAFSLTIKALEVNWKKIYQTPDLQLILLEPVAVPAIVFPSYIGQKNFHFGTASICFAILWRFEIHSHSCLDTCEIPLLLLFLF